MMKKKLAIIISLVAVLLVAATADTGPQHFSAAYNGGATATHPLLNILMQYPRGEGGRQDDDLDYTTGGLSCVGRDASCGIFTAWCCDPYSCSHYFGGHCFCLEGPDQNCYGRNVECCPGLKCNIDLNACVPINS